MSRNQHFSLFEDPIAADIRRRAAYLRQIRDSLLQGAVLERVARTAETVELQLRHTSGLSQRTRLRFDEARILADALGGAAPVSLVQSLEDGKPS